MAVEIVQVSELTYVVVSRGQRDNLIDFCLKL